MTPKLYFTSPGMIALVITGLCFSSQLSFAAAKETNVGLFVDRQTEDEWRDAVEQGAVGIQTNHPAELIRFLRANGYHN